MTRQSPSEHAIMACLNTDYGIDIFALTLLLLGADTQASVYKAQAKDQKAYFVKVKQGHSHDIGATILSLLQDERIPHIIPPLKTLQGDLIQHLDECTLLVYPFIESQNGFDQSLTHDQWSTFGNVLRRIHDITVPSTIQNQIKKETYSPKYRQIVRSLYSRIEAKPKGDEWAVKLLLLMKEHKKDIHRLVNTAESLSEMIRQSSEEFVLCHSDIHGGNVLIDNKDSIYLVDWDAPILAPKERDLMFIGGGIANVWNDPREEEFFYQGYGETKINTPLLAYYRHERIVEDIAAYAQLLLFSNTGEDRQDMYNHFAAMFKPRGVVDIAFKTNERSNTLNI